ncbi:MAG: hypothetical protein LWY06_18995 [Firmicutes bacterium]|nr:hypothetical protein [Bacillota bacterium]
MGENYSQNSISEKEENILNVQDSGKEVCRSLKSRVEWVLKIYPESRNDDRLLAWLLWKDYYPEAFEKKGVEDVLTLEGFKKLPKSYDIQRYRAHIQNKLGRYRSCDVVQSFRDTQQQDWHDEMQK